MSLQVGDSVQIRGGAVDVTNGNTATAGRSYGEGGPLWCTIEAIVDGWSTGSRWGLPSTVTKVRCSNNGVVVWQVQPSDIVKQIIVQSTAIDYVQPVTTSTRTVTIEPFNQPDIDWGANAVSFVSSGEQQAQDLYSPSGQSWTPDHGVSANVLSSTSMPSTLNMSTKVVSGRNVFETPNNRTEVSITGNDVDKVKQEKVMAAKFKTAFQDPDKKRQILNEDYENIVNQYGFPYLSESSKGLISAKYDYQIIPGDKRYSNMVSLETKLMKARAAFGIPVHGSNEIAKAMKYYMYNRFKVPDLNLAHNKTFTYVFFTRPDVNLLDPSTNKPVDQVLNHTECAMTWRRYPELFKLLTDCNRCHDSNNFNMLLSNQVRSFDIQDEEITANKVGKTWHEYEMQYGDTYTGRSAGTFRCTFDETSDYSIINLMKLWITYIDMVSRGAWSPSYNLNNGDLSNINMGYSHVYSKTIDYASSAYVFKCGPDGEDVLYWTKYYGVFPLNTGASSLSWDYSTPPSEGSKLNIAFAYSAKRDLSPISLVEFNNIAGVPLIGSGKDVEYVSAYNENYNHIAKPYVGAPFIAMKLGSNTLLSDRVNTERNRTEIRLKFQKPNSYFTDQLLYKA